MKRGPKVTEAWEVWMPTVIGGEADRLVGTFDSKDAAAEQRDIVKDTYSTRDPNMEVVLQHVRTAREILSEE